VPVPMGSQTAFLLAPLYLLTAAAVLAFLVGAPAERQGLWRRDPLAVPIAVLVAVMAVSALWSADPAGAAVKMLAFFFPLALLFQVFTKLLRDGARRNAALMTLFSVAAFMAVIGIAEWFARRLIFNPQLAESYFEARAFRVNSLFWDPNMLGRFLVIALILAVPAFIAWTGWRRWALGAASVLSAVTLVLTLSRSSWISLLVGGFVVSVLLLGRRHGLLFVVAVVVLAAVVFAVVPTPAFMLPKKLDRVKLWDKFAGGRISLVDAAASMFVANPVRGIGLDSFRVEFAKYAPKAETRKIRQPESHSTPMTIAAEQGVVGLAAFAWFLAAYVFAFVRGRRAPHGETRPPPAPGRSRMGLTDAAKSRMLADAAFAGVVAVFVHSLLYAAFLEDPFTWFLLGLSSASLASVVELRSAAAADPSGVQGAEAA
jgi:putative inorganic carbon (HCO3(-)) transporter